MIGKTDWYEMAGQSAYLLCCACCGIGTFHLLRFWQTQIPALLDLLIAFGVLLLVWWLIPELVNWIAGKERPS